MEQEKTESGRKNAFSEASGKKKHFWNRKTDMGPFMSSARNTSLSPEFCDSAHYKYELFAVVNHMGNLQSGHYTSFIRQTSSWFRCDDSLITKGSFDSKSYFIFCIFTKNNCGDLMDNFDTNFGQVHELLIWDHFKPTVPCFLIFATFEVI